MDIKNGRTVKGVNFVGIRDAGDPVELAAKYAKEGADELVFLDITATIEKRKTLTELVERVAREINVPFTVGGGIKSLQDAKAIIKSGADKVSLNSSAVRTPELITQISSNFGKQCTVVAIDAIKIEGKWLVAIKGGKEITDLKVLDWAKKVESLGAGEILLTSMEGDGTKDGYSLGLTDMISRAVNIPVIASGGCGEIRHIEEVFKSTKASAALAASVFHFGEISLKDVKTYLNKKGIPVRKYKDV